MSRFYELGEFERRFDVMDVEELERWKWYWTRHAKRLAPKVRKLAMKRVYDIEKAIARRAATGSGPPFRPNPLTAPIRIPHRWERAYPGPVTEIPETSPGNSLSVLPTQKAKARAGRIMYIECKSDDLTGTARIGRVKFSKTGRTLYCRGQRFQSLKGAGFKSNYYDLDSGEGYWISGPKRLGGDAMYGNSPIEIDEDVREEYWRDIRRQPDRIYETVA